MGEIGLKIMMCLLGFFFGYDVWHVGSWFPSKGRTCAPCSGSAESQPLDHQGNPYLLGLGMRFMLVS